VRNLSILLPVSSWTNVAEFTFSVPATHLPITDIELIFGEIYMNDNEKKAPESTTMTGAIAANLHEGSRSEYLAQFVFSSFGTSITVPHQEDSGLDIYCTFFLIAVCCHKSQ
jgi:hypothetical protein